MFVAIYGNVAAMGVSYLSLPKRDRRDRSPWRPSPPLPFSLQATTPKAIQPVQIAQGVPSSCPPAPPMSGMVLAVIAHPLSATV